MPITARRLVVTTLSMTIALTLPASCSKAAEKLSEGAVEQQTGGEVDVDSDGNVKIETDEGSLSVGTGEVPDGWPDDIGLPDGLVIVSGSDIGSGEETLSSVSGTTSSTPTEVLEHFESQLEGWEALHNMNSAEGGTTMRSAIFSLGERTIQVAATADDGEETVVNLSYVLTPNS